MATSFSASAASAAYYSGRRGAYSSGKNKSYLVDSSFGGVSRNLFKQSKVAVNQPKPVEINHADDLAILRSPVKELLVIDHNIKGYQQFSALLKPGVELLEIPQEVDGFAFLLNKLSQYQGLQAIHLFSHANAGELLLGNTIVDTETLKSNTEFAKVINQSVKAGGDFLLYGCELGKGEAGDEFLQIIKSSTHADVAASNNLTGNKAFNADWDLEIQKGDIEAKPLANSIAMKDFTEVLQITYDFESGSVSGWWSNIVTQSLGGHTLKVQSAGASMSPGSLYNYGNPIGMYSLVSAHNAYANKLAFSIQGTYTFDLNSSQFKNLEAGALSIRFTTNKGSVDFSLGSGNATKTFDVSLLSTAQQAYFQDVSYVNITPTLGNYMPGMLLLADNFAVSDIKTPLLNNAPILAATALNPTFTENGAAVALFSSSSANTNDAGQTFSGVTLTVSNVSNGGSEMLNIGGTNVALNNGNLGTIAGLGNYSVSVTAGTATVILSGMTRDNTQMVTLVNGITYRNTHDNPGNASRVVTITGITDSGSSNNSATLSIASTVSVTAVNDAPTVTGLPTSLTFIEDATTTGLNLTGVAIADVDIGTGNMTLTFTASSGIFDIAAGTGLTISGHLTNVLSLTGSLADIHSYLSQPTNIYYKPAANVNGANAATITLTANDNGNTGSGGANNVTLGSININITAVNDAPVVTVPASISVIGNQATALTGISFSDVDAGSSAVTATLSVSSGTLAAISGGGVTVGGTSSALTLTGSIAAINSFIAGVTFTTALNSVADVTLTVAINDGGNTGSGGALTDSKTITLKIADTTAPTITSVAVPANATYIVGQHLDFTLNFSENVIVNTGGTPYINITIGSTARIASYMGISGSSALTFRYTIVSGDSDSDGIAVGSLNLSGASIQDAAGNNANISLSGHLPLTTGVLVDGIAPETTIVSGPSSLTNSNSATFTFTSEAGATFESSLDGDSFIAATSPLTLNNLSEGSHTFSVRAKDAAGNLDPTPASYSWIIDTSAPTTTVTSMSLSSDNGISSSDFITNVAAQTISGILSANLQAGETVYVSIDNGASYQAATAAVGSSAFSLSGIMLLGSGTIQAHVGDGAGNQGIKYSKAYTLDTEAPLAPSTPELAASSDTGTSSTDNITNDNTPTFTGTAEAGSTVALYSGSSLVGTTTATGGNWSITTSALSNGSYTITAKATDVAGNVSAASSGINVIIDTTSPTLAITSNASSLKVNETATITFTFSEDPGATFTWNGSAGDVTVSGGTLSAISGTGLTRTATFTPTANTNNGTASISVAAASYTDVAGNSGGSGSTPSISYDTQAPAVPIGLAAVHGVSQVVLNWTANTEADLASYKIYWGDTTNPATALTTVNAPATSYTHSGLSNGTTYYYKITGVDAAGNESALSSEVSATPKATQTITFAGLTSKTYGDANFDLGATSTSGLPVAYAAADPTVVSISGNTVTILKAGSTKITASQAGDSAYEAATAVEQTLSVNAKALTATAQTISKVYDGNTGATITFNALTGLVGSDEVSVSYTSASYNDKHAGNNKSITINGLELVGAQAANYSLNTFSTTGAITQKSINVTAQADSKVYDGTTSSAGAPVVNALATGDNISTQPTQSYDNRNAGTGKTLIPAGLVINDGNSGSNYAITYVANNSGIITQKPINVTAQVDTKVYDGTTSSSVAPVVDALETGDAITTAATQSYDNRNAGTAKTLTPVGLVINDGNSGANYDITYVANNSGIITSKPINVTAQTNSKVYDGTTISTVAPLVDVLETGDAINTAATQSYDNRNAGTAKTLTASGLVINDGNSGANYAITYVANNSGIITPKPINVTAQTDSKVYDGTTSSLVVPVVDALATGDAITAVATQSYDNKNAGTGKTLTPAGLVINDGNSGTNYTVNYVNNTSGVITLATLTYVATPATKVYGDANPSFTGNVSGFVSGDNLTNATIGNLAFTTSANNTSSTGTYAINGGGLTAQNYGFVQATANNSALTITARLVTIAADAKDKIYGDADPALSYQITAGNLVNGDAFTGALTRQAGEGAGTYTINQASVALSPNYNLSYQSALLTINKAILTVTANAAERCYGDNNPAFGLSYSGFKFSDNVNSLSAAPTVSTSASAASVAGNYALIPNGGISANYIFDYHPGILTINLLPVNAITSDKGNSISRGETAVLTVQSDNGTSYSWSSAAGIISGEHSATLTVRPLETTTYTVTVRNANGCESISSFTLEVRADYQAVDAENFITPNGDGVNDNWVVKNIDAYPDHTLSIYDRSGRELYKVRNYKNDWDGTFNGMPLAEGTYYYIIRFDHNQPSLKMVKGFITIVRSK